MRTATICPAAKSTLATIDFGQESGSPVNIVDTLGTVHTLIFRQGIRGMSMQRDDGGEKEITDHWAPSMDSESDTDWSASDRAHNSDLDYLSDYETALDWAASEDFDWRDAEVEPEEYDEKLSRTNKKVVDTDGKVSRRTRAYQAAMELGLRHGWDSRGIELIASIFEENGWSATKRSLDREMEDGMSPDELAMAMQIRGVWNANPEFASVYLRGGYYGDQSISVVHQYTKLSWPAGLKIARAFDSVLDEAEMESLLLEFYDEWMSDWSLKDQFRSFANYLLYCLGLVQGSLNAIPGWAFEEFDD